MKILILIFALLSLSFAAWEEIFTLGCNGQATILGKQPLTFLGFDASTIIKAENFLIDQFKQKVLCECPSITDSDFKRFFLPMTVEFLFNMFAGPKGYVSAPINCDLSKFKNLPNNTRDPFPEFVLPSSCNQNTWDTKGTCLISGDWTAAFGVKLGLAISKCAGSYIPYISLTCEGVGCSNLLKPCNDDASCGTGMKCTPLTFNDENGVKENKPDDVDIFNLTATMLLYDKDEPSPGCYAPTNIMTSVYNFITNQMFDRLMINPPRTYLKICIPASVTLDEYFLTNLNSSSGFDKCVIEKHDHPTEKSCYNDDYNLCNITNYCYNTSCRNSTDGSYYSCEQCNYSLEPCQICTPRVIVDSIDCTPSFLKSWDGMSGTVNVVDPARVRGDSIPKVASKINPLGDDDRVYFLLDCSGNINIVPNGNYHFALGVHAIPIVTKFFMEEIVKNIVQCRIPMIMNDIFKIMYGIEGILYYLTNPVPLLNIPLVDSWTSALNEVDSRLNMPKTCTYEHWTTNKFCALQYDGIKSLVGLNMSLRLRVSQCDNSPSVEIYVGCKGLDCFLGNQFGVCDVDLDCTPTTRCSNIFNFSQYDNNPTPPPTPAPVTPAPAPPGPGSTNASVVEAAEGVSVLATPIFYFSYLNEGKCWDSKIDPLRLGKNGIRHMEGLPLDTSDKYNTFMCFVDPEYVKRQNFTKWAEDQVVVDGTLITLVELKAWDAAPKPALSTTATTTNVGGGTGTGGGGGDGTDSGNSLIVMSILFFFMLFI